MKRQLDFTNLIMATVLGLVAQQAIAADPWADRVIDYMPGSGVGNDFADGTPFGNSLVSLGEPTRFTSDTANFGGAVTPLSGAFRANEVVTVGAGGSLTVAFDEPVTDDPGNPFGIDLLIFSNSFFFDADFPNGIAGTFGNEGGVVEVSSDGLTFLTVNGVDAEGLYPTLGYQDLASAFESSPGNVPTDFTRPVDPAFDPAGLAFAQIVAGYNGSGGGVGVDLATVGLSEISYVRVSNPLGATGTPEIDAFADVSSVPEPTTALLVLLATLGCLVNRRR